MPIQLSKEENSDVIGSMQRFFRDEMEFEELSKFRIQRILDYMLQEMGPFVYNKAIEDSQRYFREKTIDINGACYHEQLTYWKSKKKGRNSIGQNLKKMD